jgi:hypothetical protein
MTGETKKCPYCGGEILAEAMKCKHCREFLHGLSRVQTTGEKTRHEKPRVTTAAVCVLVLLIIGYASISGTGSWPSTTGGMEEPTISGSENVPGEYYVTAPVTEERLSPSLDGKVVNRIYLQQKVTVYRIAGEWALVTEPGWQPRWVICEHLSRATPELPTAQLVAQELQDPRIERGALPQVGEFGLTQEDIHILWKGANLMLKQGRCTRVVSGDKSTSKPNTYYVSDGPRNYYFTANDVK